MSKYMYAQKYEYALTRLADIHDDTLNELKQQQSKIEKLEKVFKDLNQEIMYMETAEESEGYDKGFGDCQYSILDKFKEAITDLKLKEDV